MSKKSDKTIPVIAMLTPSGTYSVVTSVQGIHTTVGNYLGQASGLTEQAATALADRWMEFRGKNDHQTKLQAKTLANPKLRPWDSDRSST